MGFQQKQRCLSGLAPMNLAALAILAGGSVYAGNQGKCIDNCADIPKGAIPLPNGSHVRAWQDAQVAKAHEDDFVIYRHEWYLGGPALGPYGTYHIHRMAAWLPQVPFAVIVQPEANPQLNEIRRAQVVRQLLQAGVADAEARVVIDFPQAEGLNGTEAQRVYLEMISGTGTSGYGGGLSGGGNIGGGLGGAGGFGGVGGSLGITSRGY